MILSNTLWLSKWAWILIANYWQNYLLSNYFDICEYPWQNNQVKILVRIIYIFQTVTGKKRKPIAKYSPPESFWRNYQKCGCFYLLPEVFKITDSNSLQVEKKWVSKFIHNYLEIFSFRTPQGGRIWILTVLKMHEI